ncbi:MAG: CHAT domain-containing protein [Aulosira sp. DedQUE10]|nr:CHAT domain-containing protein [Aulosira sp. DedQUE10]
MMRMPAISFVIKVYNQESNLSAAIESILAESRDDFELVIWDAGSTDGSLEIAREYEKLDRRVRVVGKTAEHRKSHKLIFPSYLQKKSQINTPSLQKKGGWYKSIFASCMSPLATLAMIFGLLSPIVKAQSITPANDGTGSVITTEGNKIDISGGSLSSDRTNLFHSFSKFGLDANQTANFLSQPSIQNILGRVTGNNASLINGLIQVTGGNSNLYLINPAGIIFGSSASLNVPAAFTATTANGVGFGNNQWFNAIGSNNYANLIGHPTEFAFTTSLGGNIFNAGNLAVGEGQSLMLLGGMVLNTGTLAAPNGNITIMAVPAEKVVRVTPTNSLLSLDLPVEAKAQINPQPFSPLSLPALLTGGNIKKVTGVTVENGVVKLTSTKTAIPTDVGTSVVSGQVSVSNSQEPINKVSNATPQINILGDRVALLNANINASGNNGGTVLVGGDYQGKGTVPTATHTFVSSDSTIAADALQSGNGGKVIVWADDSTRFFGNITARGGAIAGNGGLVETSGKLSLNVTGSKVDASAVKGQPGTWLLDPTDINIVNGGSGTIVGGLFDPANNSDIDPLTIVSVLDGGTDVTLTTSSGTGGNGDITLTDGINQTGAGNASLTLTGRRFFTLNESTINLSSTGNLTFNLNQVNPEANAPTSSIQNAIDAIGGVAGNSIINLGAGTYTGNTVNIIEKTLTLNGAGASNTIIDGINSNQLFSIFSEGIITINNLAIINGRGVGNDGGGIAYFGSGTLNVNNITFTGNSTEFSIESGGSGGGIYSGSGTLNVNNSTFSGNSASNGGGGIYNGGEGNTVNVNNSTFSSNSATNSGGGLYNTSISQANINSSTFSGNLATDGGGIYNESGALTALKNTIVAGNTSSQNTDVSGLLDASSSYNLIGDGTATGISNGINGNQVGTATAPIDAQLSVLGNYGGSTQTFALLPGSPAINAGIFDDIIITDQRGISRPQDTAPDIGAFELVGYTLTPTAGSGQSAIVNNIFSTPLQATVTENGFNQPISGITVNFTAPTVGATGNFTGNTVLTTDTSGNVSIPVTANTVAGSYAVTANSGTLTPANFSLINNPDVAAAIIATGGTPQTTVVNTAFTNPLQAKVQDQYGNAIANATVTFNAPTGGATANFTGSTTLTTDTSGNVAIPVTANTVAGSYAVTASSGTLTPANFSLTNNPDVAAAIIATGGTPQSTIVNTAFTNPLQAKVQDQYGNAIANATVTFNAPTGSATANFTGNTSLTTDSSGNVSIPLTANTIAGSYAVTANSGTLTPANFSLINNPDVAAAIIATGGTPQSTIVNTAFTNPLQAKVQDQYGNAIANATVTFNAPTGSTTASFTGNTSLTTDSQGNVSIPVIANTVAGNYNITASSGTLTPANFSLINNPDVAAAIIATGGTPQSTIVNTAFTNPLQAKVQDQYGNAIANATVTFNAPTGGTTANFTGSTNLTTDSQGNVSIPVTANTVAGNYNITANSGALTPANFSLTNNPDVAAAIIAIAGTPQSTIVNTAFTNPLQAKVQDQYGNAIANATVTFNAPTGGTTANFTGSTNLTTDSQGNVSIPVTANTVAGNYNITANSGALTPANFSLTNNPDVAAAIIAIAGTPQSTIVNTAFNNPLQAKVQDQYGNAIANATVTFNAPTGGATANFTGSTNLTTDTSGNVNIPVTANTVAGSYNITANSGALTPANFSLINNPDVAAAIIATGGTPQTTVVNTAFNNPLQAKVQDQYGNAIANATVTFNAPTSGTTASFTGNTSLTTDSQGNVSIPVTANTVAGSYAVTANSGSLTPANFSLTNNPDSTNPNTPEVPTTPTIPINTPNPETFKKPPTTQIPVTTNPTTEVVLDTAVANIEQEYTTQFQEYLGDAAKPNLEAPNTARNILQQISDATGIQPALIYVNFIPTSLSPANTLKQNKPKILPSPNDRLELVIVTAKGVPIRKVLPVTRSQIIATAQTFTKYVTKNSRNQNYIDPAKKLYQWLITPVETELQARKINNLAFIMDEGLRSLPVAALYDGQKYLVETYSVGLMPSLSLTDTKYVDIKKAEVLGMGASEFRNQNPLPAVPTELVTITSRLWQGNFFLNENFTLRNLQQQRQQKPFGIIHLATHAEFEPGDRSNSYIQMWDTQLKMDQLRQLGWNDPPVELVVLSSCRTAIGDKEAEFGFAGFAVQAGVKSALASLWYVSDEGTLGLMSEFYEQLKKAPIKAEALRQAQIAMLNGRVRLQDGKLKTSNFDVTLPPTLAQLGNQDLQHPYFWSAFTMIGNPW